MSSLETFCESAHRLLQYLEREIDHQFQIMPIAKLIASFVTNVTHLFENQLYEWYWETKNTYLDQEKFNHNAFLRNWYACRTNTDTRRLLWRDINTIIHEDDDDCWRCHRYQCYYSETELCICGEPLCPADPTNQRCWRAALSLLA